MKYSIIKPAALGALLTATTMSASAAVESFSADYGSSGIPVDIGSADLPTVQLQKFDTTLGTLNDIVIKIFSTDTLQTLVVNLSSSTGFQNAQTAATITISGQDGTQSADSLSTDPFSGTVAAGSFSNPQMNSSGPVTQQSSSGSSHVALAGFAAFETAGTGFFDYILSAVVTATSSGQSSPYMFFGYKATSFGNVEVDYDYTPAVSVPEAGTAMAGCFAMGLAFFSVVRSRCARA